MTATYRPLAHRQAPAIGLGLMGMSEFYGATDDAESLATLHAAFELGVRHFDTADTYGAGHGGTAASVRNPANCYTSKP